MTEPTYEDYYPAARRHGFTPTEKAEYSKYFPGTFEPEPEKPSFDDAMNLVLEYLKTPETITHNEETP